MKALAFLSAALGLSCLSLGHAAESNFTLQVATSLSLPVPPPQNQAPTQNSFVLATPAATVPVQTQAPAVPAVDAAPATSTRIASVDHTAQTADIWERMRHGFAMQNLESPLVDDRMRYYLARPAALKTMLERSRKYMYYIVGELEKRGMPTELALLPVVESAFNPLALSSAKAAGLWQFIPSTGKSFALTQNWWVDERRDIVASTDAALTYLQSIYEMHGDWQLALASYNWGENAVARAIANNKAAGKPTDFASLRMPEETRYYVPKLQAIKNIIARPEQYGISLPTIANEPYFSTIDKMPGMDVALAAKLAEMPTSEFLMLNPGYNRPVMPGSDDAGVVLPVENARKFKDNLAKHLAQGDAPLVTWKTYLVPQTARVEQIARNLGLAVQALCSANGLSARALLAAGYKLLVPSQNSEPVPAAIAQAGKLQPVSQKRSTRSTRPSKRRHG
jgi:membrane-bound lytic murein transglycosylase D